MCSRIHLSVRTVKSLFVADAKHSGFNRTLTHALTAVRSLSLTAWTGLLETYFQSCSSDAATLIKVVKKYNHTTNYLHIRNSVLWSCSAANNVASSESMAAQSNSSTTVLIIWTINWRQRNPNSNTLEACMSRKQVSRALETIAPASVRSCFTLQSSINTRSMTSRNSNGQASKCTTKRSVRAR